MCRDVDKLLLALQQDSSLKVWSLIVTFFGDAVVVRGGNVFLRVIDGLFAKR